MSAVQGRLPTLPNHHIEKRRPDGITPVKDRLFHSKNQAALSGTPLFERFKPIRTPIPHPPNPGFEGPPPEESGSEAQGVSNRPRRHPSALRAKNPGLRHRASQTDRVGIRAPSARRMRLACAKRAGCGHSPPRALRPKNPGLRHKASQTDRVGIRAPSARRMRLARAKRTGCGHSPPARHSMKSSSVESL